MNLKLRQDSNHDKPVFNVVVGLRSVIAFFQNKSKPRVIDFGCQPNRSKVKINNRKLSSETTERWPRPLDR